jgi:hypothetical protein
MADGMLYERERDGGRAACVWIRAARGAERSAADEGQ